MPPVALAGSAFLATEDLSVDAEGAGRKLEGMDDDTAPPKDGPLAADAGAVGFSVGLPVFGNRLVAEAADVAVGVERGATVDALVVWPPISNMLFVFVVELLDSAGLGVNEGKLNDGFDSVCPSLDGGFENRDEALFCSDAVGAADCPPVFWKNGFAVSV